jgi:hypothetical protein
MDSIVIATRSVSRLRRAQAQGARRAIRASQGLASHAAIINGKDSRMPGAALASN